MHFGIQKHVTEDKKKKKKTSILNEVSLKWKGNKDI